LVGSKPFICWTAFPACRVRDTIQRLRKAPLIFHDAVEFRLTVATFAAVDDAGGSRRSR
jgi:hypothetical protein